MSHMGIRRVTRVDGSYYMFHIGMRRVTRTNESCHIIKVYIVKYLFFNEA